MANLRSLNTGPHKTVRKAGDTLTGRIVGDDDAPESRTAEPSREVLMSALQAADKGSALETALLWALEQRSATHAGDGGNAGGGGGVTSALAVKLGALLAAVLGFVNPVVSQGAERMLSPTSALERKLDTVIAQQAELQQSAHERDAITTSLAKWIVKLEADRYAAMGLSMPEPPASVKLIIVQDEIARSTGP